MRLKRIWIVKFKLGLRHYLQSSVKILFREVWLKTAFVNFWGFCFTKKVHRFFYIWIFSSITIIWHQSSLVSALCHQSHSAAIVRRKNACILALLEQKPLIVANGCEKPMCKNFSLGTGRFLFRFPEITKDICARIICWCISFLLSTCSYHGLWWSREFLPPVQINAEIVEVAIDDGTSLHRFPSIHQ